MKKIISLIMIVVILCVGLLPLGVSAATTCNCNNTPIINIRGRSDIVADKTKKQSTSNPALPNITASEIETHVKNLIPVYTVCNLTGNYDRFAMKLAEIFANEYKDYALDKNGNIDNNSGISLEKQWSESTIKDVHKPNSNVTTVGQASTEVYKYFFIYDCRIDTFKVADELHQYIETVKKVTGHSKVRIVARCFGTNLLSAYLVKYGWEDIETIVLYNPIMYGTNKLDCIFTGDISVTQDSLDYISENFVADTDSEQTIKILVDIIGTVGGFDFSNETASHVVNYCIPEILRESYATCPGYWSMLSADAYEKARDYIFEYYEDEYAEIIRKNDYYHENVRLKLDELYQQVQADGVNVYTIAKYGTQLFPIMADPNVQSDDTVTVETQVPGSVTAPLGSTFGDAYLEDAASRGRAQYISPDKTIDLSTALFREQTWFVKDLLHDKFPKVLDMLIYKLLRSDKPVTVNSFKEYPQYMVYESDGTNETLSPVTSVDPLDTPLNLDGDILVFLKRVTALIVKFVQQYYTDFILK